MSLRKSPRKIIRVVTPVKASGKDESAAMDEETDTPAPVGEVETVEFAMGESDDSVVKVLLIEKGDDEDQDDEKRSSRRRRPLRYREKAAADKESDNVYPDTTVEEEEGKEADDPTEGNEENTNTEGRQRAVRGKIVMESMRTDEEKTCRVCDKLFPTYRQFRYHAKYAHKEITCPHCEQKLYSKTTLDKHIWAKHREHAKGEQRRYPCRFCDKVWQSNSSRFSHEATHKERRFECSVCKQLFFNGYTRNQHELTHSNDAVRCSFCKRLFENATVFAGHLQRQHPDEVDTHGAGIWNVGTTRKAKLRGSKVEREVGVVVAEYDDADPDRFDNYPAVVGIVHHESDLDAERATDEDHGADTKAVVKAGATPLVVDIGEAVAMQKAVIKCQTCGLTCADGSDMIGHLLTNHPNILQIKLI